MGRGMWPVVACLSLAPISGMAQPVPAEPDPSPAGTGDREVLVTGEPGELPVTIYAVENVTVNVFFEAPLRRPDGGTGAWPTAVPGADVRFHPFRDDALVITPAPSFSRHPAGPWRVPLAGGDSSIAFTFVSDSPQMDHLVRILQRPPAPDGGTYVTSADIEELAGGTAAAVLGEDGCNPFPGSLASPQWVTQHPDNRWEVMSCAGKSFNYIRVLLDRSGCLPTSAFLLQGGRQVKVFLLGVRVWPGEAGKDSNWQMLVTRSPPVAASDYEIYLRARDGTVCKSFRNVWLAPGMGTP